MFLSQNNEDDWNGFDVNESAKPSENAKPPKVAAKVKPNSSMEDFNSLDVKSKVAPAPTKPKDDKEDDLWDMLNS